MKQHHKLLLGLCLFIALLSFKPSEPYLSQYLICNKNTQSDYCSSEYSTENACDNNDPCLWSATANTCKVQNCDDLDNSKCGNDDFDYCEDDHNSCRNIQCYKHFTEDEVNNEIYPWSTYAYLPILLTIGPYAELFSYRAAILFGISGRVVTRFLLIYGNSILDMQIMQVVYALGTAAEDVFSAYIYYVITPSNYQSATCYIKASALLACVFAGILGDLLVILGGVSLTVLMWISCISVCLGFGVGVVVLARTRSNKRTITTSDNMGGSTHSEITTSLTHNPLKEEDLSDSSRVRVRVSSSEGNSNKLSMFQLKLKLFRQQFQYLKMASKSYPLCALITYWVIGNAVFSTLYDYEVSIYQELKGDNEWNGCVLAVMLLAGSAGAMLPTFLRQNSFEENQINSPTQESVQNETNTSEFAIAICIIISGILSSLALVLFVSSWEIIASVSFLALFFAFWQYINVICFTRIALALKFAQMEYYKRNDIEVDDDDVDNKQIENPLSSTSSMEERQHVLISTPITCHRQSNHSSAYHNDEINLNNSIANSHNIIDDTSGHSTDSSSYIEDKKLTTKDEIAPPYSVAIVAIIAMNVIIQIILQAIAFSGLGLELHYSCWIFVLVFCSATAAYITFVISIFGITKIKLEFINVYRTCKICK